MRFNILSNSAAMVGLILLLSCRPLIPKKRVSSPSISGERSSAAMTPSRITPMKYDQWQVQAFDYIGLKVDLPDQAHTSPSAKGPATLSISMHYLSPPPGVLDDATVFVSVYVERLTLDQFADQKAFYLDSGLYKRGDQEDHKFWLWYYDLHPDTASWSDKGNNSSFRRDIKLNDKEILNVHAEVLNAGPQESRDADHAAVKRILDSIQPLIVTTNK